MTLPWFTTLLVLQDSCPGGLCTYTNKMHKYEYQKLTVVMLLSLEKEMSG